MGTDILIASSLKSQIDSATGTTRELLLRRLCAMLKTAYDRSDDSTIVVLGAGSDYAEVSSQEELAALHVSEDIYETTLVDPLELARKLGCHWANAENRE